jgi:kinase domain protein
MVSGQLFILTFYFVLNGLTDWLQLLGIAADWWSVGVIIYELITGQVIFSNVQEQNPIEYFQKKNCKQIIEGNYPL